MLIYNNNSTILLNNNNISLYHSINNFPIKNITHHVITITTTTGKLHYINNVLYLSLGKANIEYILINENLVKIELVGLLKATLYIVTNKEYNRLLKKLSGFNNLIVSSLFGGMVDTFELSSNLYRFKSYNKQINPRW